MLDAVYVSMLPPGSGTGTRVYDRMRTSSGVRDEREPRRARAVMAQSA